MKFSIKDVRGIILFLAIALMCIIAVVAPNKAKHKSNPLNIVKTDTVVGFDDTYEKKLEKANIKAKAILEKKKDFEKGISVDQNGNLLFNRDFWVGNDLDTFLEVFGLNFDDIQPPTTSDEELFKKYGIQEYTLMEIKDKSRDMIVSKIEPYFSKIKNYTAQNIGNTTRTECGKLIATNTTEAGSELVIVVDGKFVGMNDHDFIGEYDEGYQGVSDTIAFGDFIKDAKLYVGNSEDGFIMNLIKETPIDFKGRKYTKLQEVIFDLYNTIYPEELLIASTVPIDLKDESKDFKSAIYFITKPFENIEDIKPWDFSPEMNTLVDELIDKYKNEYYDMTAEETENFIKEFKEKFTNEMAKIPQLHKRLEG